MQKVGNIRPVQIWNVKSLIAKQTLYRGQLQKPVEMLNIFETAWSQCGSKGIKLQDICELLKFNNDEIQRAKNHR